MVFFPPRIFLDSFLPKFLENNVSLSFLKNLPFLKHLTLNIFSPPAIDSSSTTSSASPVLNNYDALEGGGYPGKQFIVLTLNYSFKDLNVYCLVVVFFSLFLVLLIVN